MTLKDKIGKENPSNAERKPQPPSQKTPPSKQSGQGVRLTVKHDCGYSNTVFIRGKGASLSWEKGVPLKNVGPDEWVFEINEPFSLLEFKFLINDEIYESGENRRINQAGNFLYRPMF